MISCASMWAIVLRHIRAWRHDWNALLFGLYWPVLDIMTWGFLGAWIQQSHVDQFQNYETVTLIGLLLWQVVGRGGNIILMTLREELWSNNIINLFSLPLRLSEWIGGVVLFCALMTSITTILCMFVIVILYNVSLWYMISTFLIFFPPLFLCGLWLGFTALQIVIMLGKRGIELGAVVIWFLQPFSGAFYPIEILPDWGQALSALLPMSYVFQGMRKYLTQQHDPTPYLLKGFLMSTIYATVACLLFVYCFNRSKLKGITRLTD